MAPALRKVGAAYRARSGVPVFVFPTGPGLILPQLVRDIQNDIVVTQATILRAGRAGRHHRLGGAAAQWRNPLVIAGLHGTATSIGAFAATDPSPASDIDGPAVLARLGIKPTAIVLGAVDTDEVAFLLTTGAAQAGLLHMTDVRADARLGRSFARCRPRCNRRSLYAASVTRLARRPNPEGFVAFLATQEAADMLADSRSGGDPHDTQPRRAAASAVASHSRTG